MSEVLKEILIRAKPETIFTYFTEAEKLLLWLGVEATLEAQVGGHFEVRINAERKVIGQYLELLPYSKLRISWGWEGRDDVPPGASTVEVELTETAQGTLLRLRHFNLPEGALPLHAKSWDHNLPRLKHLLESYTEAAK